MAKITIDELIRKLEALPGKVKTRRNLEKLASFTQDMIYRRVKSGFGVTSDDTRPESTGRKSLERLSKSYVEYRQGKAYYFQRNGKVIRVPARSYNLGRFGTGQFFSPGKSNLTNTGQMLEAMAYKVGGNGFTVFIRDTRRTDGDLNNAQVADYVSEKRPFMALHKGELIILKEQVTNLVQDAIRNSGL